MIDRQTLLDIANKAAFKTPEFSASFKKWIPFLCTSVNKVSWVTGRSDEDVLQDILIGVSEINLIYDVPLYRYQNKLYEKIKEDGSLVFLRTPRNNKSKSVQFWTSNNLIEPVKKGKLESTIYREINQQVVDAINSHFTQKNGFKKKVKDDDQWVVRRSKKDKLTLSKKKVHEVNKIVDFVDGVEDEADKSSNPEDNVIFNQYVNKIKNNVSLTVAKVLDVMIADPRASVDSIAEFLGISVDAVVLSKCEIIQNIPFDFDNSNQSSKGNHHPIYITVD